MKWAKGVSGNPHGRPRVPEIELFREALAQVEKEKGKSFLKHAVERAFVEDTVCIALLKKILPDKIDVATNDLFMTILRESRERLKNTVGGDK